ncbi:MAG: hypothetical protein O2930_11920 [Acidobacteria bacterium]|nr:hypothetical protein [Acidobacteriota bacterium]
MGIQRVPWLRGCGLALLSVMCLPGSGTAQAPGGFGAPCSPGEFSFSGNVLVCSEAGAFRNALSEDLPPAPAGGYVERPSWYPSLSDVFHAVEPPRCPLTGRVTFTSPVVRIEDVIGTTPQGLMVADHVTPIDHGYIGVRPLNTPPAERTEADYVPISAPADAEVIEISLLGAPNTIRVVLANGCDTYSIYMVLNRLSGALAFLQDDLLARGSLAPYVRLLAGEEFAEQRDNPVDFSVHDGGAWLSGFVSPFSYTVAEAWKPYTVDPWPYFSPDLAAAYEASMLRLVPPRWGTIDQDVPGTASGNWFVAGTVGYSGRSEAEFRAAEPVRGGPVEDRNTYAWSHLAIVRHHVQPGTWMLSTGWWRNERGDPTQWLLGVDEGQPQPSDLTAESGLVVYRLWSFTYSPPYKGYGMQAVGYELVPQQVVGLAAVQVREGEALAIELKPDVQSPAGVVGFSPAVRVYRR